MNSFMNRPSFDMKKLFTMSDISEKTKSHLTNVYALLMACTMICALGMFVNANYIMSGFFMNLISVGISIYLIFQVVNRSNSDESRQLYFAALAF